MKLDAPIGNALYAPLLVRVPLGVYFILDGMQESKVSVAARVADVKAWHMMPEVLTILYSALLPYVEIIAGAMIAAGFLTILASILLALIMIPTIMHNGILNHDGRFLNQFVVLLGACLSLLYSGAGAVSVDRFRKGGG